MAEVHRCTRCGETGSPSAIQKHVERQHSGGRSSYGAPTVDVLGEKPANTLKPGARVSWDEDGGTRHGTVWAEAPSKRGSGPHRHVIPDGTRATVALPTRKLTQTADPLAASRVGEFHFGAVG